MQLVYGENCSERSALSRTAAHDPWRETVSVASRGSRWKSARPTGSEEAEPTSGQTIVSSAPQKTPLRATRDHSRYTEKLCSSQTRASAKCRAAAAERAEPSCGTCAPVHTTARAEHAEVHISPHTHSAFSPPLVSLLDISNQEDIVYVLRSTIPFCRDDSSNGMRQLPSNQSSRDTNLLTSHRFSSHTSSISFIFTEKLTIPCQILCSCWIHYSIQTPLIFFLLYGKIFLPLVRKRGVGCANDAG